MSGRLDDVSLPELVQLFATGGRSVRIEVTTRDGGRGRVTVEHGHLSECSFGDLLGEEAFFALFQEGGRFHVYRIDPERSRRAAVSRGWQELILEAARREDEAARDSERAEAEEGDNVVRLPVGDADDDPFGDPFADAFPSQVPEIPAPARVPSVAPEPPSAEETPQTDVSPAPITDRTPTSSPPEATPTLESLPTPTDAFDETFAAAMRAYLKRDLAEAQQLFDKCLSMRPNDARVKANLERLASMRKRR